MANHSIGQSARVIARAGACLTAVVRGKAEDALRAAVLAALPAALALALPAAAQQQPEPPSIVSMGQPLRWQTYASGVGTFGRSNDASVGLMLGVFHPIGSPVNGVLDISPEAYVLAGDGRATGGARLLGVTRAINLGYGVDWDAREGNFAFMLSFNTAVRRGGIFGHGTMLRVDWIPPRGARFVS